MTSSDFRVLLVFIIVIFLTTMIGLLFGTEGLYFVLSIHTLMNAFFIVLSLIANGKI